MRVASYNVENLFDRARLLASRDWATNKPVLEAYASLTRLLQQPTYTAATRKAIVARLAVLGLSKSDDGLYVRLRQTRGELLRRGRDGVEVVARGRGDWVGWLELETSRVDEAATVHTARVIADVDADVLGVVEAEHRTALKRFSDAAVAFQPGKPRYPHVMLIDGNDERGIDVGLMAKDGFRLGAVRSHVDDVDDVGRVFSRDCPVYEVTTPGGARLTLILNHLKSKGYGSQVTSDATRRRQAVRAAVIYRELRAAGAEHVVVLGDLNDTPGSAPLAPLLAETDLRDISDHPGFDDGGRPGTYGNCTAASKIDYVLLSPSLSARCTGGGIFRQGIWGGKNGTLWPHYDTMTSPVHSASDHAAVYADLDLG